MSIKIKKTKISTAPVSAASTADRTRLLICPDCREHLSQVDVESFWTCPYCGHPFERNLDLEDFLLEPLVENWIRRNDLLSVDHSRILPL